MKIEVDSCIHGEKPCPLYSFEDQQCVLVSSETWIGPIEIGTLSVCPLKNGPITITLMEGNEK